ncbi:hypothetical protein [Nocardia farcinica]|uniref:hypothetical protein n=1 Tax=Nocardia farcinica TaxID=37329 RepID=UPI00245862C3|nr:hypothetical protein [Nocardia farcinica]
MSSVTDFPEERAAPIPAELLPDPAVVAFVAARADEEADLFPERAAAIRAILAAVEGDIARWREGRDLKSEVISSFWAGAVASSKTTINYLAMAYRTHPEFPEHCREWMFPSERWKAGSCE